MTIEKNDAFLSARRQDITKLFTVMFHVMDATLESEYGVRPVRRSPKSLARFAVDSLDIYAPGYAWALQQDLQDILDGDDEEARALIHDIAQEAAREFLDRNHPRSHRDRGDQDTLLGAEGQILLSMRGSFVICHAVPYRTGPRENDHSTLRDAFDPASVSYVTSRFMLGPCQGDPEETEVIIAVSGLSPGAEGPKPMMFHLNFGDPQVVPPHEAVERTIDFLTRARGSAQSPSR